MTAATAVGREGQPGCPRYPRSTLPGLPELHLGSGARLGEFSRGGHFPAMEEPDLLVAYIRAFFRKVRGVNPG